MSTTYYAQLDGTRILNADRTAAGNDDTDVSNWVKTNPFIYAVQIGNNGRDTTSSTYQLKFRKVGDSTFNNVTSTSVVKYTTNANLQDGRLITGPQGSGKTAMCTAQSGQTWDGAAGQCGMEIVNRSLSDAIDMVSDSYTEMQFALAFDSTAEDGAQYEFQVFGTAENAALTVEGGAYAKITLLPIVKPSVTTGLVLGESTTGTKVGDLSTATLTTGLAFGESVSAGIVDMFRNASASDGLALGESVTAKVFALLSDAVFYNKSSDNASVSDSLAFGEAADITVAEEGVAGVSASVAEGLAFGEVDSTTVGDLGTSVATSLAVGEVASAGVGDLSTSVSDSLAVSEDVAGSQEDIAVFDSDSLDFAEGVTAQVGDVSASVADGLATGEAVSAESTGDLDASASDGLAISEVVTEEAGALSVSEYDSLAIAEADTGLVGDILADGNDGLAFGESTTCESAGDLLADISTSLAISEAPAVQVVTTGDVNASVTDGLAFTEVSDGAVLGDLECSATDGLAISGADTYLIGDLLTPLSDGLVFGEAVSAQAGDVSATASDSLAFGEALTPQVVSLSTLEFSDDFEANNLTKWTSSANASTVASGPAGMSGSYCADMTVGNPLLMQDITADDEYYCSFAIKFTYNSLHSDFITFTNGTTDLVRLQRSVVAYTLAALVNGSSVVASSAANTLLAGVVYNFQVYVKIADSGGRILVNVNGSTLINYTGDTKPGSATQINRIYIGADSIGRYGYFYLDNFILDHEQFVEVRAFVPTALAFTDSTTGEIVDFADKSAVVAEGLTLSESVTRTIGGLSCTITDALALSDTVQGMAGTVLADVSDGLAFSEDISITVPVSAEASDGLAFAEAVTAGLSALSVAVTEGIALAEGLVRALGDLSASTVEGLAVNESAQIETISGLEAAVSDALALAESVQAKAGAVLASTSEGLAISEVAQSLLGDLSRSVSEALAVSEQVNGQADTVLVALDESLKFREEIITIPPANASVEEGLAFGESITAQVLLYAPAFYKHSFVLESNRTEFALPAKQLEFVLPTPERHYDTD